MNIAEIIMVLQNKIRVLENAKNASIANGDMIPLAQLEVEILNTQASLEKIQSL